MNESTGPVRLALLGSGVFVHRAYLPALAEQGDAVEVSVVMSRTRENAERVAAALPGEPDVVTDVDAALARDDVDAVLIVLPIPHLPGAVELALTHGKHVMSEKPVAPTSARARELVAFYAAYPDQIWMVAENWRYEPAFIAAAEHVASGALGRLVTCNWAAHVPIRPGHHYHGTPWRRTGEVPGGLLLDAGVHFAAALRLIVGELESATAAVRSVHDDLPPCDTVAASLRFENGAVGTLAMTFAAGAPWPAQLTVVGTEGALRVGSTSLEVTRDGEVDTVDFGASRGVQEELAAFVRSVRDVAPHRNGCDEALRDLLFIETVLADAL